MSAANFDEALEEPERLALSALNPENGSEAAFLSTAYGPRMVGGRKVGSLRTVAERADCARRAGAPAYQSFPQDMITALKELDFR